MVDFGKIPPQAIDIEEALLGCLLLESNIHDTIIPKTHSEYFYKDAHQKIFEAIKELYENNLGIDILTVTNKLKDLNELESVGGAYYISTLTNRVGTVINVEQYYMILLEKYLSRFLIQKASEISKNAYNTDVLDCIDYLGIVNDEINQIISQRKNIDTFDKILQNCIEQTNKRCQNAKEGIPSGIPATLVDVNKFTNGWQNSDLIILAARPSMGKTAIALRDTLTAAYDGKYVIFFSLEMSKERLADRLICMDSKIDFEKYNKGYLNAVEWESIYFARERLNKLNIIIDDSPHVNVEYIKSKARLKKNEGKCDLIVIDYLQLMKVDSNIKVREQQISDISRKTKLLAKELNIPVILLSQLNRKCEERGDKKPLLSDLRESGAIEQDADQIIFVYRPDYYGLFDKEEGDLKGQGKLIFSKNRNGATGEIKFTHNESLTQIFDYYETTF